MSPRRYKLGKFPGRAKAFRAKAQSARREQSSFSLRVFAPWRAIVHFFTTSWRQGERPPMTRAAFFPPSGLRHSVGLPRLMVEFPPADSGDEPSQVSERGEGVRGHGNTPPLEHLCLSRYATEVKCNLPRLEATNCRPARRPVQPRQGRPRQDRPPILGPAVLTLRIRSIPWDDRLWGWRG